MGFYNTASISPHYKEGFILCGFPGIGKTDLADHPELWPDNYKVVELDSSKFSKDPNGNKRADFAVKYFEKASKLCSSNKIVLVSAHQEMRDELVRNDVHFVLVNPPRGAKDVWIERLRPEGSSDDQVNFIEQDWDAMIDSCNQQTNCTKFVIPKGVYLSDMINELAERMNQPRQPNT